MVLYRPECLTVQCFISVAEYNDDGTSSSCDDLVLCVSRSTITAAAVANLLLLGPR